MRSDPHFQLQSDLCDLAPSGAHDRHPSRTRPSNQHVRPAVLPSLQHVLRLGSPSYHREVDALFAGLGISAALRREFLPDNSSAHHRTSAGTNLERYYTAGAWHRALQLYAHDYSALRLPAPALGAVGSQAEWRATDAIVRRATGRQPRGRRNTRKAANGAQPLASHATVYNVEQMAHNLSRSPLHDALVRNSEPFWADSSLLNASQIANGTEFWGSDAHLGCVRRRIEHGLRRAARPADQQRQPHRGPVSLAVLGGSISAGSTVSAGRGKGWTYHSKLAHALGATHHDGSLPATGPAYFEHCFRSQLPRHGADLVLVEFSVNIDIQGVAGFERLLRGLLALRPAPAIIVVSSHVWLMADPASGRVVQGACWNHPVTELSSRVDMASSLQARAQRWKDAAHRGDEDAVAALCRHYGVPLVSARAALLDGVRRGALRIPGFMRDCKHPNAQGHTYLAQLALGRILAADRAACAAAPLPAALLPPPLHENGLDDWGDSQCVRGAELEALVAASEGFKAAPSPSPSRRPPPPPSSPPPLRLPAPSPRRLLGRLLSRARPRAYAQPSLVRLRLISALPPPSRQDQAPMTPPPAYPPARPPAHR